MINFDNLTPSTSAFIDQDNQVYDFQQVLQSGSVVVSSAPLTPVIPIGSATTPKFENIAPWVGKFVNQNNQIIGLLEFLQSGAIQVQVSGGGDGGLQFVTVTAATHNLAINTANYINFAGDCVLELPALAAAGSVIRIISNPAGDNFRVTQNIGQTIYFGAKNGMSTQTTAGLSGYIDSIDPNTVIELQCTVTNTNWVITNCQQEITGV